MLIEQGDDKYFVKLLDFGLAKNQSLTRLTETGEVLGTISYLPPEQISQRIFNQKSDVYSLGVIFYELITLEKPFLGEQPIDIIKQILEKDPLEPLVLRAEISSELNTLINSMLAKNPEKRPSSLELHDLIFQLTSHP